MSDIIAQNALQNPPITQTYVIKAQANGANRQKVFYAFNYFRVMALTLNTLSVNIYGSGDNAYTGAGVAYKLPNVVPWIELINTGASDITVTIALGIGDIEDTRFTTSNTLTVNQAAAASIVNSQVSVTNAATQLVALNANRKRVIIKNPITGTASVFVGITGVTTANGVEIGVGESLTLQTSAAVFGIHAAVTENIHVMEEIT